MNGIEKLLLLFLGLAVSRQRSLAEGRPGPDFLRALLEPPEFHFFPEPDGYRCVLTRDSIAMFRAALFIAEERDFVAPVSGIDAHLRYAEPSANESEVRLHPTLAATLGLQKEDCVYAVYSPLQILFRPAVGFFIPGREVWHAYAGRGLAANLPEASAQTQPGWTQVRWSGHAVRLGQDGERLVLSLSHPGGAAELRLHERGFEWRSEADPDAGLQRVLCDLAASGSLPQAVTASREGSVVRLTGRS